MRAVGEATNKQQEASDRFDPVPLTSNYKEYRMSRTDHHAAASAVCAAKSNGWTALRRLNADEITRFEAREAMLAADVMAEEFRVAYHPEAQRCFGIGDREIGQPFQMYALYDDGDARVVWGESA